MLYAMKCIHLLNIPRAVCLVFIKIKATGMLNKTRRFHRIFLIIFKKEYSKKRTTFFGKLYPKFCVIIERRLAIIYATI